MPPAADLDAKTKAIEDALDRPVVFHIPNRTTLAAALKLVRETTAAPGGAGVPIHVDPFGLQEAGAAMDKPIDVVPFLRTRSPSGRTSDRSSAPRASITRSATGCS